MSSRFDGQTRSALVLGAALLCFWPTMHNELMYPVSVMYRAAGGVSSYPLHILYLALVLVAGALMLASRRRVEADRRLFRRLCYVGAATGLLGGVVIATASLGASALGDALAGVGVACYALYFAAFFMLAFSALARTAGRLVMPCVFGSYAVFCAARLVTLRLGLSAGMGGTVLLVALPVASSLLLSRVPPDPGDTAGTAAAPARLRDAVRYLPWASIAPALLFVYVAAVGVALLNVSASWAELPATRDSIYAFNLVVCAAIAIVSTRFASAKWLTLGVLSALAVYFVATIRLSVFVSSSTQLNFGTGPLIASELVCEVFLLAVCAKACSPARRNAMPAAPLGFAYLALVIVATDAFSTLLLLAERSDGAAQDLTLLYIVAGAATVAVIGVIVVILLQQLARANEVVAIQKEKRGRASAEEMQAAIMQGLDLSPREAQVAYLLCCGQGAKAIADQMALSESTVYAHMKRIYRKLGLHSKQELVDLVAEKVGPTA